MFVICFGLSCESGQETRSLPGAERGVPVRACFSCSECPKFHHKVRVRLHPYIRRGFRPDFIVLQFGV